jgi:hypothetical protein
LFGVKTIGMMFTGLVAAFCNSCTQQQVTGSVAEHSVVEGSRYAEEVAAQSPFETVEISWSEAENLMKKRNQDYRSAASAYQEAIEHQPLVQKLTSEMKGAVTVSFSDVLKPKSLVAMLNEPVTQIPKQLASLSKIKDISHSAEEKAWQHTEESVDAKLKMREKKVKLQTLLRTGELLDGEMSKLKAAPPLPEDAPPKLEKTLDSWRGELRNERKQWLGEVRDFFNAEYSDVHFVKDDSGLPTYRNTRRPDLSKWERWCQLRRSKELVKVLKKVHSEEKPTVPGTRMVKSKLAAMFNEENGKEPILAVTSVRGEVRKLIQNWREMKEAQKEAEELESKEAETSFESIAQVNQRKAIFNFRQKEIEHRANVWLMDEQCWDETAAASVANFGR